MVAADILRCDLGEPTMKRVKKAKHANQQRLKYLCVQYVSGAKFLAEILSRIQHVIRIKLTRCLKCHVILWTGANVEMC